MNDYYRFPRCTVTVNHHHRTLTTTYDDGATIVAAPNHDPASINRAYRLGYHGDTWAMTLDHDPTHHHLAQPGVSPTLWNLAHHLPPPDDAGTEEATVLTYQADLDKSSTHRPWTRWETNAVAVPRTERPRPIITDPVPWF